MTAMAEALDWEALPTETQEIAALLADGWTQAETARLLGFDESTVARTVSTLRSAMLEQLQGRDDILSRRLTARADELAASCRENRP
jgi:DNA-directed RNA polymerase specialized sigma24 family protein